jgi:hypothetical protein
VNGETRVADVREGSDWLAATEGGDGSRSSAVELDAAFQAKLAAAWLDDARMEHASIASFARFALELLAAGAPAELLERAQRAALDEVEHARICFALASRFARRAIGPAPLDVRGTVPAATLGEAAVRAVHEGCVGETIAALMAAEQLAVARDAGARRALERIARDEATHAELAWRFVQWALGRGDSSVRDQVKRAFAEALATPAAMAQNSDDATNLDTWHAFGRLSECEARHVQVAARSEVITPCMRALLRSAGEA